MDFMLDSHVKYDQDLRPNRDFIGHQHSSGVTEQFRHLWQL